MSLVWADFPSGSQGLYSDESQAVGIYGDLSWVNIIEDPDALITGRVLHINQNGDTSGATNRYVYPTSVTTIGVGKRVRTNQLPNRASVQVLSEFRTTGNAAVISLRCNTSGDLTIYNSTPTLVATNVTPYRLTPGAWHHIEFKATVNGTTLTYEARLNGITVLSGNYASAITELRGEAFYVDYYIPLDDIHDFYTKDIVYWDGNGSTNNNNFFGTVSVTMQNPNADILLQWDKSAAALTGSKILNASNSRGYLSASAAMGSSGTLRIDGTYYSFTSGSVDAGTPAGTSANPWLVAKGTTDTLSAQNFFNAVNGTGTPGTSYSTALTTHATVTALGFDEFSGFFRVAFQANDLVSTYTVASTISNISATAMSTGLRPNSNVGYISAGLVDVDTPSEFSLTDLPADITSVRGLISVIRLMKVDGGDAEVLVSIGDGVNYDNGGVWPTLTAPNFQIDVSELNPTTAAPWTPVQANAAQLKLNRTV